MSCACKTLLAEGQEKKPTKTNFPNIFSQIPSERAKGLTDESLNYSHSLVVAEVLSIGHHKRNFLPLCKHVFETLEHCLVVEIMNHFISF